MAIHSIKEFKDVRHPPEAMFALVMDVESYPAFVPFCTAARISERHEDYLVAALHVSKGPFGHWFSTRNRAHGHERIDLALVDGPFRSLQGSWTFVAREDGGCRVGLELDFEFSSRLLGRVMAPAFSEVVASHDCGVSWGRSEKDLSGNCSQVRG